jgi:hypothetical protein
VRCGSQSSLRIHSSASKTTHTHSHGQIRTLDLARADVIGIGVPDDWLFLAADAISRTATLLALNCIAVNPHQLGILQLAVKGSSTAAT